MNFDEVRAVLEERFSVRVLRLEGMAVAEQLRHAAGAAVLAGAHGAALNWCGLMQAGGLVLHFNVPSFHDHRTCGDTTHCRHSGHVRFACIPPRNVADRALDDPRVLDSIHSVDFDDIVVDTAALAAALAATYGLKLRESKP